MVTQPLLQVFYKSRIPRIGKDLHFHAFTLVVYLFLIRRDWIASVFYRYDHSNPLLTAPLVCGCSFIGKRDS